MTNSVPESLPTLERTARIYDALSEEGFSVTTIENPNGEPLGVKVTGVVDPTEILGSIAINTAKTNGRDNEMHELRNIIPISGSHVYPARFLDFMDVVVRAAANENTGLATRINSSTRGYEQGESKKGEGIGLHVDYPGSGSYLEKGLRLHGLNIHNTQWGLGEVRLGLVRDLEVDALIQIPKKAFERGEISRAEYDSIISRFALPFTDLFELGPGDTFIFQAEQHAEQGITPVMHEFVTVSDTRLYDSFRPHIGEDELVLAQRQKMIEDFAFADLGY